MCNVASKQTFKEKLKQIDANRGLSQMACQQNVQENPTGLVETRFGKCQVGSFLSYQLTLTESNFKASACIDSFPRLGHVIRDEALTYPRFPIRYIDEFVIPDNLSEEEHKLIPSLKLDEDKINQLEAENQKQADSAKWNVERKLRLTASKFHLISRRQRNHDTFAEQLPSSQGNKH